ncbi:hypothetical protein ACFL4K_00180 [Candidatus Neomarinimicrobiota bacterium]
METQYYLGIVQAGTQVMSYQGRSAEFPPFYSCYIFLGWGLRQSLYRKVGLYAGIQVGYDLMVFKVNGDDVRESELQVALNSGLIRPLWERYELRINISRQFLFTHKRITRDFLILGLGYSIKTPKWLQDFLE